MNEAQQTAIETAMYGDPKTASELLTKAIQADPNSQECWYWLGTVLENPKRKHFCFMRVLALNPQNTAAWQALNALENPQSQNEIQLPEIPVDVKILSTQDNEPLDVESSFSDTIKKLNLKSNWTGILFGFLLIQIMCSLPIFLIVQFGLLDNFFFNQGWVQIPEINQGLENSQMVYATPSPIPSAEASYMDRMAKAEALLAESNQYIEDTDYHSAIEKLNEAIALVPDYDELYYQRAYCYYNIFETYNSVTLSIEYIQKGIDDLDEYILLRPIEPQAYIMRGSFYWDWASYQELSVDRNALLEIAIQNFEYAKYYGAEIDSSQIYTYLESGKCEEAQTLIEDYFSNKTTFDNNYTYIQIAQAYDYACFGEIRKGLDILNSIEDYSEEKNYYLEIKAALLYQAGKYDEALEILSDEFDGVSNYFGTRDYLRALIYLDNGQTDVAKDFLQKGRNDSWYEGGLYSYINGLLHLQENDETMRAQAIEELQYAEAGMSPLYNVVRWRIQKKLSDFNSSIMENTTTMPEITAMPTFSVLDNESESGLVLIATPAPVEDQTPAPEETITTPETTLDTEEYHIPRGEIQTVRLEDGASDIMISMGGRLIYHFVPPVDLKIEQLLSLKIFTETDNTDLNPPVLEIWNPTLSTWTSIQPDWGLSNTAYPDTYVFPEGDIYIAVRSASAYLNLTKLDIGLVFKDTDGNMFAIGRMEE